MSETQIADGRVVEVQYRLLDDSGAEIDSSEASEPLSYVHGTGQILPGLERELEGRMAGDEATIVVAPEDGFGPHREEFVFSVPRSQFEFTVEPGSVVEAQLPDGRSRYLQVTDVSDDSVTVDGNHPMAGKTLRFEVTVASVRDATPEELEVAADHDHAAGCDCGDSGDPPSN
jgi:FKBP-type peptidyl-prolyl cis-trans isomerase SlyD